MYNVHNIPTCDIFIIITNYSFVQKWCVFVCRKISSIDKLSSIHGTPIKYINRKSRVSVTAIFGKRNLLRSDTSENIHSWLFQRVINSLELK